MTWIDPEENRHDVDCDELGEESEEHPIDCNCIFCIPGF